MNAETKKTGGKSIIPVERIEDAIFVIRGERVMIDEDLARLYGVPTKRLNEQVKRNRERFPDDFMFQLNKAEFANLKSHFATASWGGRRTAPFAFTEHGALMAANVLKSPRAAEVSIQVVRTFMRLRRLIASNAELARKLDAMEKKYDKKFQDVFATIRQLMLPPDKKSKRTMGFR